MPTGGNVIILVSCLRCEKKYFCDPEVAYHNTLAQLSQSGCVGCGNKSEFYTGEVRVNCPSCGRKVGVNHWQAGLTQESEYEFRGRRVNDDTLDRMLEETPLGTREEPPVMVNSQSLTINEPKDKRLHVEQHYNGLLRRRSCHGSGEPVSDNLPIEEYK